MQLLSQSITIRLRGWEIHMSETGDESVQLTDDQRRYFQSIFDYFKKNGAWPTFAQIERIHDDAGDLDAEEAAKSVGKSLFGGGYMPWTQPNYSVTLPLRIVAICDGSEHLMQLVVDTVGLAYRTWRQSENARITSEQLQNGWQVSDHDLRRLGLLLLDGGLTFWTGFGGVEESGAWFMQVGRGIRKYRDVKTVDELLAALPPLPAQVPLWPSIVPSVPRDGRPTVNDGIQPPVGADGSVASTRNDPTVPGGDHDVSRIFVSYRRDDSADICGRIYDQMEPKYGRDNVVMDVETIPLGVDFRPVLTEEVDDCDVMLVIIGRQWLTISNPNGQRRLDNPADFVRIEIEAALARGIPVIPVMVQNATIPRAEDLPPSLAELAYRNGITIHSDPHFHRDMDLLIGRLDDLIIDFPANSPVTGEQIRPWWVILRDERPSREWSQLEVAEKLGVPVRTLREVESGRFRPRGYLVKNLCDLYERTARELGFSDASQSVTG
jgi:DNA-binding XRE family transcriptional regulator